MKIIIDKYEFTPEEAKKIHKELNKLYGEKTKIVKEIEYVPYYPVPYYPPQRWEYPYWYSTGETTVDYTLISSDKTVVESDSINTQYTSDQFVLRGVM